MSGRSLQLSEAGQQQARQALLVRSLTQKAIAYEQAVASWSTVNKFFNGKPVDRFIFQEICTVLGLDWQAVVECGRQQPEAGPLAGPPNDALAAQPDPLDSAFPDLLTAIQGQAQAAREALDPRILQRIPRQVVREKYLAAIARGVEGEKERLIAVIGPAGYGKSTILGDVYDQLLAAGTPWVGLVLCGSLSLAPSALEGMAYGGTPSTVAGRPGLQPQEMIAAALGQGLCGDWRSVVAVCQALTHAVGRGVLLIDTLDLVINRDFVVAFGALMRQVLAGGTTVMFTCRDHEYNDFLEPVNQQLPGLSQAIDRHTVPNFSTAEIRSAAVAFFQTLAPEQSERGQAFADQVLALSTDNRSLRDILENPLLLALLCDLFGETGAVPPDLTVSKLYQRYWHEKVTYSRIDRSHHAPLAIAKEDLCLTTAQRLFERSDRRLYESFYRDDLGLRFTPAVLGAYNDLLSEGVLTSLGNGKVHFFHQTLLEYAIAYWLTRQSAEAERTRFFQQFQVREAQVTGLSTHWLPVLRQFLAIVEEAEFEHWLKRLDLEPMGVFGAVAFAAVSRDRPDALGKLLPVALQMGETHQQRLRQALAAAPRPLIETIWDLLLDLLAQAEHVTASNTVQMVGELLARWWSTLSHQLDQTLTAIARRLPQAHERFPKGYDDRSQLLGWLLQPCWPLVQAQPEASVLAALRQQVSLLGHGSNARLIECHHGADSRAQYDLLRQLLAAPVPRYEDIKTGLVVWIDRLLPDHLAAPGFPLGQSWAELLHGNWPYGWAVVLSLAVARWAARDGALFAAVFDDYLFGPRAHISGNLTVLKEAMKQGAGPWVWPYLQGVPAHQVEALSFSLLVKALPLEGLAQISPADQGAILDWLRPHLHNAADELWPLVNDLADTVPGARQILTELTHQLPPPSARAVAVQLLRFQPIETHPPLLSLPKSDQRYLIALYKRWVGQTPQALTRLLETAVGQNSDVAIAASSDLATVAGDHLAADRLLPLVRSPFAGVRVNGLAAIAALSERQQVDPSLLAAVAGALHSEDNPTVGRLFAELVTVWVRQRQQVVPGVLEALEEIGRRMANAGALEGGLGRAWVVALKQIARSADSTVDGQQLCDLVRLLVNQLHVIQIKNGQSEVLDLLLAVHRLQPKFLGIVLQQDGAALLNQGWFYNVAVVIKAVARVEGMRSPLLDQVLQWYGEDSAVRSLVLKIRGA